MSIEQRSKTARDWALEAAVEIERACYTLQILDSAGDLKGFIRDRFVDSATATITHAIQCACNQDLERRRAAEARVREAIAILSENDPAVAQMEVDGRLTVAIRRIERARQVLGR